MPIFTVFEMIFPHYFNISLWTPFFLFFSFFGCWCRMFGAWTGMVALGLFISQLFYIYSYVPFLIGNKQVNFIKMFTIPQMGTGPKTKMVSSFFFHTKFCEYLAFEFFCLNVKLLLDLIVGFMFHDCSVFVQLFKLILSQKVKGLNKLLIWTHCPVVLDYAISFEIDLVAHWNKMDILLHII